MQGCEKGTEQCMRMCVQGGGKQSAFEVSTNLHDSKWKPHNAAGREKGLWRVVYRGRGAVVSAVRDHR